MLHAVGINDVPLLRELSRDSRVAEFFRRFPPPHAWPADDAELLRWFAGSALEVDPAGNVLAIVQAQLDYARQSAEFGVAVIDESEKRSVIAERALRELVTAIFNQGFHKVYCNFLESRTSLKKLLEPHGFKVDGVLRDNVIFNGEFRNEVIMSCIKSEFR
jgi:RimJ/RimL family protein N-acetyltransferase